jgi:hypothetical protein
MQRTYSFENVQVDPAERALSVAGKPVALGGRAFGLCRNKRLDDN